MATTQSSCVRPASIVWRQLLNSSKLAEIGATALRGGGYFFLQVYRFVRIRDSQSTSIARTLRTRQTTECGSQVFTAICY